MALTSTVHRLKIALSDVERGVYAELDTRIARHPSETARHLCARALAYALRYDEALELGPGLCVGDEPALSITSPDGRGLLYVDVGTPSGERLHRASKAWPKVVVYTHLDPALLVREARSTRVHKLETIEAFALPASVLDALEARIDRTLAWEVLHSDGTLYVTCGGETFSGPLVRLGLVPDA